MTTKTKHLMETLNLSEAEALELQETDKRIDRGEKLFELPKELEAGAKKARQADRKPTVYNFAKKERKKDSDKRKIISIINSAFCNSDFPEFGELPKITITNPEREIIFTFNGRKFKITLSAPRS